MKKKISPLAIVLYLAMALMLVAKLDFVRKMYDLSQMPDMTFYFGVGLQPGVLLPIVGSVLTQFCYFPVLGAALVLLSMMGLTAVCKKAVGDNALAYLPATFVFAFLMGIDYAVYTMRAQGILFSQTLGLALAALAVWGSQKTRLPGWLPAILAVVVGYPLIGAWAIVAALAICTRRESPAQCATTAAAAVVAAAAVPWLYTHFAFSHIDARYTWFAGTPYMDFVKNGVKFIPLGLAALSLIAAPAFRNCRVLDAKGAKAIIAAVVMAAIVVGFAYKDRNFHVELAMERAIERNDWKAALKHAEKAEEPTRVIVMYRNIALLYTGQLCQKMFTYPNYGPRINTPGQISQTEVCAPTVFFYNGLINYSTRWAWEMSMMFQRTVQRYKYQAKVALFTGQEKPELIEKYLTIIGRNWFEKGWVKRYRRYLEDPAALAKNQEYQMFQMLNQFEEVKYMSSAVVEDTLLSHFLSQPEPQGPMLDLSLAAAMTLRNTQAFWHYFNQLCRSGRPIQTHVAEAAMLFAYLERDQALIERVAQQIGFNSVVVSNFQQFSGEASGIRDKDAAEPTFRKRYGKTYWYYCYFTPDLMTD